MSGAETVATPGPASGAAAWGEDSGAESAAAAVLGAAGPLARALPGFRARPVQQRMAARVEAALRERGQLLIEAGTGTGKTYAYLVPALLSGLRVLISTGTRTLQDQLFHRDLPQLAGALGRAARVTLLKGRSNYLCRDRAEQLERRWALLPGVSAALPAHIAEWMRRTSTGDLAELRELPEADPLRAQLSSTRESCSGVRCSHYANCHVLEARRAATEADIVVVNHHLLLADLALKEDGFGDLLPAADAVILDEAHQLPDLVSEFFGQSFASRQLEVLLSELKPALRGAGQAAADGVDMAAALAVLEQALAAAHAALGRAERHLDWHEAGPQIRRALQDLQCGLEQAMEHLDALSASPAAASHVERARALLRALTQISGGSAGAGEDAAAADPAAAPAEGARVISVTARGFVLRWMPYDVSERFRAFTLQGHTAWIFTSATLAVGEAGDFTHFARRLGLEEAATLRLDSPFDYARQALLYLPSGLPDPSDPDYTDAVIDTARPLLEASGGGAFLLFTSHRALQRAALTLRRQLPPRLPLLVQGEAPREQLLRRFRASGQAVLLGTSSFWEGVDVQGPALRLVIIDKLPFAPPDDPVVRARVEHLKALGANPFRDYQLPEAVLALKQGAGRLIRSEDDQGVLVVCDPRLTQRSYGRMFRDSLPPMSGVRDRAAVLARLEQLAVPVTGEEGGP